MEKIEFLTNLLMIRDGIAPKHMFSNIPNGTNLIKLKRRFRKVRRYIRNRGFQSIEQFYHFKASQILCS